MIKKESFTNPKQILFMTHPYAAVGVTVSDSEVTAGEDGKKIVKAGTPLCGSLRARTTAFTTVKPLELSGEEPSGTPPTGVLVHDVDVTDGAANGTLMILGYVDENKVDSTVISELWTDDVIKLLSGKVELIK